MCGGGWRHCGVVIALGAVLHDSSHLRTRYHVWALFFQCKPGISVSLQTSMYKSDVLVEECIPCKLCRAQVASERKRGMRAIAKVLAESWWHGSVAGITSVVWSMPPSMLQVCECHIARVRACCFW